MGRQLILLLMKIYLTLGAMQVHGSAVPLPSPPRRLPRKPPTPNPFIPGQLPSRVPDHGVTAASNPLSYGRKRHGKLVSSPHNKALPNSSPVNHSPSKATPQHDLVRHSSIALPPSMSFSGGPGKKWVHGPASPPSISFHKHYHARKKFNSAPEPSYLIHPPTYSQQGPSVSPFQSPYPSSISKDFPAPAPSPTILSRHVNMPILPPKISPLGSTLRNTKTPPPLPLLTLPPPPPNEDCTSMTCTEPLTYAPPGAPCACVWPIEVKLRLSVAIYKFFSLVSELAEEIAASISLNRSQVRIMGADAASQQLERTSVLINLVPKGLKFNDTTSFSIYEKFWHRQVSIKASVFGAYEILYVHYPGLPPSPPSAPSSISAIDDGPYAGHENNGRIIKPLGVAVPRRKKNGLGGSMIIVIVLSSFTAFIICVGLACLLLLKCGYGAQRSKQIPHALISSPKKSSGAARSLMFGSMRGSASMSYSSGTLTYIGTAKTFTLNDIERATNNFDPSTILGEGGFGLVYSGILDDGKEVAVKLLKRDDQHGSREFLAEVEMLSRLHHRNLVKLIGICTEHQARCLVYELVPNGRVESHLHGADKKIDPLDWDARMKIALGAARGLAYLHEDSNPRVIHRDFKSSNILLEDDFTPKVSDFGLARTALDEGNKHISTHVMGTFGYLAPEYAMTGHLLVKSDVYSYGVVLLELLTGRKPVDLSQPPGQENLVAWARPLLTSEEGLETIIDPAIKSNISINSVAKAAAIASMCVQPEVSHRPFMGEVVQALKLVCNEFDETHDLGSRTCSQEDLLIDLDSKSKKVSSEIVEISHAHQPLSGYDSSHDTKIALSASDLLSTSVGLEGQEFESFRRQSTSGPLRVGRKRQFWQRLRSLSGGSMSEHGVALKLWPESH
ncbi:receptor-like serine/threonine-protein kinase ALE2 isoform X2 [Corylus avellana]|uniref:receptor-like serine/threonine-protein kinase ALE2 isoform X2 n=1 Tax=Corylus avellana TaxID=13451 RepID=UPI00286D0FE0|nr:receptor-like serine/threonine-protein kinase ALE2 isoform X2 [Corylus avellana]